MRLLLLTFAMILTFCMSATAAELVIIANSEFPIDTASSAVIKKIYLGKMKKKGNIKIKPFDLPDKTDLKGKFTKKVLGFRSVMKYNSYWIGKVFKEGGVPPVMKKSIEELIESVEATPGAIAYCYKEHIAGNKNIKILMKVK